MHSPSISQGRLIGALNNFFREQAEFEHRLNTNGVCLPLSLGFAFQHLLPDAESYGPDFFYAFLKKMSSPDSIEEFFTAYQTLTLEYQQAHIQKNLLAQQEAKKKLQPYWSQLALIDLLLLVYADQSSYARYLSEGQGSSDFAIRGVEGTINPMTMTAAGLKVDGAMSCKLRPADLEEFLFGKHTLFSSKVAPFKKGGTYIVTLPRHACALHVTLDGKVKFYDPNYKKYISELEDLQDYQALFEKYTDKVSKQPIPIEVFAVSLLENDLKNKDQIKKIEKRLGRAGDCFLKKNFDHSNYQHMLHMGLFRSLFYSNTPYGASQLRQVLSDCEKNNISNFWDLTDRNLSLSQPLIVELFHAVHKTRNFELLKLVFSYKKLRPHNTKSLNLLNLAVRLNDVEFLTTLIDLYPERPILSKHIFELARARADKNDRRTIEVIISGLLSKKITLPQSGPVEDPLKYLRTNANSDLFAYALEAWAHYHQTQGVKRSYHIDEQSLLSWMMDHFFTPDQIDAVIKAGGYLPDERDYMDIIHGGSIALKRSLLSYTKNFHDWEAQLTRCTPLEACLEARDFEFLKDLLDVGVKPKITARGLELIPQSFMRGDFDVLRLLTTDNDEPTDLPEARTTDQRMQREQVVTLQKITLKQPLTQRENQIFCSLFSTLLSNESLSKIATLNNAIAYSWPLETARYEDGRSLVEYWLSEKRWEDLITFAAFFQDTDLIDKAFVREKVIQICEEQDQKDMSGLVNWIRQSRFSWNDLLLGDKKLIKTLCDSVRGCDSYGLISALMAQPSSHYTESILNSLQSRLESLQHAKTPEDLQKIISDLHCIKELIQVGGIGQQDVVEYYPAVLAAIDEITDLIPRVTMENTDVPTLVQNVLMAKTITQKQDISMQLQLAEEQQIQQVSQISILWDFFQKRLRDF